MLRLCVVPFSDRPEGGCVGAWGTASFENDDAKNWLGQLNNIAPKDLAKILTQAAESPEYLEAPAASVAVAAAEVIAAWNGFPAEELPVAIMEWTKRNQKISTPVLKALAVQALERVRRNSELKDLWMEADGLNDWTTAIQNLQSRLRN
jgi:hypothetical protein